MKIRLVCVEDGLENMGCRKFAGYVKSIYRDTKVTYVPTGNLRSIIRVLTQKGAGKLTENDNDLSGSNPFGQAQTKFIGICIASSNQE